MQTIEWIVIGSCVGWGIGYPYLSYKIPQVRRNGPLKLGSMPRHKQSENRRLEQFINQNRGKTVLFGLEDNLKNALLVRQYDGATKIGFNYDDVDLMDYILTKKGYNTNCLSYGYGNKDCVEKALEQIADKSTEENHTFLYFSAHGINGGQTDMDAKAGEEPNVEQQEGICIFGSSKKISPEELYKMTEKIKGKKIIMIDSCHSGIFVDYIKKHELIGDCPINNYVIIAACPAGKTTKSNQRGWNGFIGHLTFGFYIAVEQNNWQEFDLATADIKAGTPLERGIWKMKEPFKLNEKFSLKIQRVADTNYVL